MRWLLRDIFSRLFTLAAVLALTFLLLHVVPGGPFDSDRGLPPEIEANLYQKYDLTKRGELPFWIWVFRDSVSYAKYLSHGKLGPSLKYVDRDASDIIKEALPASLTIGSIGFFSALMLAVLTALILTLKNSTRLRLFFTAFSSLFVAMPSFLKAIGLITIFSLWLKWLPPALWGGPSHLLMPILTLAIGPYFLMTEFLLTEMTKEQTRDYARTARAKGLKESVVLIKHVLCNALNPLLALLGPIATTFVTGSFIVETVFSIPGLGRHFILAIIDRDYFLVMGLTAVFASILLTFNLLTDWLARKINPLQETL
jgi:oligopeptide transport system permease protein